MVDLRADKSISTDTKLPRSGLPIRRPKQAPWRAIHAIESVPRREIEIYDACEVEISDTDLGFLISWIDE